VSPSSTSGIVLAPRSLAAALGNRRTFALGAVRRHECGHRGSEAEKSARASVPHCVVAFFGSAL
jgi:hypothetical protein